MRPPRILGLSTALGTAIVVACVVAIVLLALTPVGVAEEPSETAHVHLVLIADTNDPQIGSSVLTDLRNVERVLGRELPASRRTVTALQGDAVSPEGIRTAIEATKSGPSDALVVYYAGHGAWADQGGHYLRLHGGNTLARGALLGWMRARKPRLLVLLTDCCSTYVGEAMLYVMPVHDPSVMRDLFFRHRGEVDVTAAQKGEEAVGDTSLGGYFTHAFTSALQSPREDLDKDKNGVTSWAEVVASLKEGTTATFRMLLPRGLSIAKKPAQRTQTPVVFGNLPTPPATPLPPSPQRLGVKVADAPGGGAEITEVVADSAAAWANLRPGVRIKAVRTALALEDDRQEIQNAAALGPALLRIKGPALVVLEVEEPAAADPMDATREAWVRLGR